MRTTVDLPADLMRAAKARAAEHGESLKAFFTRAVAHELRVPVNRRDGARVVLPLVGSSDEPPVSVTNADIEDALAEDDADQYGAR
jgi:signal transduction histidine kinase